MAPARPSATSLFVRYAFLWLRDAMRILHRLWLEVTGALFVALAALATPAMLREWRLYRGGGALWRPGLASLFVGMMAAFGLYSFLKARQVR